MFNKFILIFLLILPLTSVIILSFLKNEKFIKNFSIFMSFFIFLMSLPLWILFDKSTSNFQYLFKIEWISQFNINFFLGLDGISLFFIILTTFLIPICMLISYETITKNIKEYFILYFILEFCLIISFSVLDLLIFYIFFESVLIPMFLIIGIWGSRERKIKASYLFFMYTLAGSLFMFIAIIHLFLTVGTTDYQILYYSNFNFSYEKLYFLVFFLSFAVKVPMLPFHVWLPEAHVEAPTAGSVLLAGILLKLGSYGMIRFLVPLFPKATLYFTPYILLLCLISVIYASLTAIRQTDLKRIIAYASVAHMNFIILGIFSLTIQGLEGSIIQMISHGLVSSGLFFSIGCLYDRYHTRFINYYGGLAHTMPLFCIALFIYILANMAIPGSSSFVGEILILTGVFEDNTTTAVFATIGMFLGGIYSLLFYNRICYGNIQNVYLKIYYDLTYREFLIHLILIANIFLLGLYPKIFESCMHESVSKILIHIDFLYFC
uniref:NADH-ubiquinone oxidoreductase chain 4 n=1 Tax=Pseudoperonospora cubensis TaxID=143453 RepID=A0A0U2GJW6_PSECC|nr:NADH dehydrogenase subunit 4 [Pseudoperonospora cubensis]AKZ29828.1 NADH dehydrogenase subunit 4 [Pseudoperonospora cubensis]